MGGSDVRERLAGTKAHQFDSEGEGVLRGNGKKSALSPFTGRGWRSPIHLGATLLRTLRGILFGPEQRGHVALHPATEKTREPGERAAEWREAILDARRHLGITAATN